MEFKIDDSLIHPAIREMEIVRYEQRRAVAGSLAKQQDDAIRAILDERAPGWTLEDIGRRLRWQTYDKLPGVETLLLDGHPVMELWPPRTEEKFDTKTQSYTLTFVRDVWRA